MNTYQRYQRQILLKEFGIEAQEKLLSAKVLVIGAGGLGCPALQYLAAAGVGTIGIADDDVVALTNLHRQVLYAVDDMGLPKADIAAARLRRLNDEINIIAHALRLTNANALKVINNYDIVIDGTDNFASKYMINDACVLLNKPLVYGAVSRFEGQVAVFNIKEEATARAINYRDLFPEPPKNDEVLNCTEAGVLGVLPGIIGTMQASETIKLITRIGRPLINKLLTYNTLDNSMYEFNLSLNDAAQTLIPKDEAAFFNMVYEWVCSSQLNNAYEIDVKEFDQFITDNNAVIIDVREKDEQPFIKDFEHLQIPLNELADQLSLIEKDKIVLFCQSGKRSLQAAKALQEAFNNRQVHSLKGGITEWKKLHALQAAQ